MTTISIMGGGAAQPEINAAPAKKRGRPRKSTLPRAQVIQLPLAKKEKPYTENTSNKADYYDLLKNLLHIELADKQHDYEAQQTIAWALWAYERYCSGLHVRFAEMSKFSNGEVAAIRSNYRGECFERLGNPQYKDYLIRAYLAEAITWEGIEQFSQIIFYPLESLAFNLHVKASAPLRHKQGAIVRLDFAKTKTVRYG